MTGVEKLTERGVRDMLSSIAECRVPLRVRREAAEREAALAESAAHSLAKVGGMLDALEEILRARLAQLTEEGP